MTNQILFYCLEFISLIQDDSSFNAGWYQCFDIFNLEHLWYEHFDCFDILISNVSLGSPDCHTKYTMAYTTAWPRLLLLYFTCIHWVDESDGG